jgi:hypothetical protein
MRRAKHGLKLGLKHGLKLGLTARRDNREQRMTAALQPLVFTIDVGPRPVLTFEAKNLREAHEMCHESWLLSDLKRLTSNGERIWDGKTKLRARYALDDEQQAYRAADAQPASADCDDLTLVFLIAIDRDTN